MKSKSTTTSRRFERGSLLFVGAALIGASSAANASEGGAPPEETGPENALSAPAAAPQGLREALLGGNFWLSLRYRFETVDQESFTKDARASTLQTRLGYETASHHGMSGVLEFSDVATVPGGYEDYNDGSGSPADRPVIGDPSGTVVNQVYMKYSGGLGGDIKLGRQRIKLNEDRFIGNVGWRQTEQNYDAITYDGQYDNGMLLYYGYLDRANTPTQTNRDMDSHILNFGMTWENLGTLLAYGYYLDFANDPGASTVTYGVRFTGDNNMDDFAVLYGIEIAQQEDVGDNTFDVDAAYSHVHLGARVQGFTAKIGFETLDGDSDGVDTEQAFQTPLGTLHDWNGWADKFLTTPAGGLEDLYFHVGYESGAFGAALIYHEFDAELSSGGGYGDEVDVLLKYNVNDDMAVGVKFADYTADTTATDDTQKAWFWMAYSI